MNFHRIPIRILIDYIDVQATHVLCFRMNCICCRSLSKFPLVGAEPVGTCPPRRARFSHPIFSPSQISNLKSEIARSPRVKRLRSDASSSANPCGSQRLGVIFFLAVPPAARKNSPALPSGPHSATASCNSQLQLDAFLGSVDCRGLTWSISPLESTLPSSRKC